MRNHPPFPRSGRVVTASLGTLFLVLAAIVLHTMDGPDWRSLLGALFLLVLAADLLLAARRRRWPVVMPFLVLP
ncbi:MAG TPA: hypothetical protein VFQ39_12960 [Longimicrobium sp.]|nr:hypothetical protein [Longimicrobium sp.]